MHALVTTVRFRLLPIALWAVFLLAGRAPCQTAISPQPAQPTPPASIVRDDLQEDRQAEQILIQEANAQEEQAGPPPPAANVALGRDEVLIRGDQQEKKQDMFYVRGHADIRFRNYTLRADQVTYDSTTGVATVNGHVVLEGGPHNEHLVASHGSYDVSRDTGKFYDVSGSTGVRFKGKNMFLTSSTPFFFTGKVMEKLGPDRYRVHKGEITSCRLPKPKWEFDSQTATVEVGEEARLYHATLRVKGVPLFYFPYLQHPADNLGRKSGFLLPEAGSSTVRGTIFGDSFYWAINRNSDATIGAELYSKVGWAQLGDYRIVGYNYAFNAQYFGVVDSKGPALIGQNPGGHDFKAGGWWNIGGGFQAAAAVNNLSSYLFRLRFALSYADAITSEVRSSGYIAKNWNGYGLGIVASRYQNYETLSVGDFIDIAHIPSLQFSSMERPFSRSRLVYAYDVAAEGLSRHEIGFQTAPVVGRVDAAPYIALPAYLRGWSFRPEAGFRETYYSQRLVPGTGTVVGTAIDNAINRNVFSASLEVRPPTLERIFQRKMFGAVLKHSFDPYMVYRYQNGIQNFSDIIRFDQRDILADTHEVEYGIINRLWTKKSKSPASCFDHPQYDFLLNSASAAPASGQTPAVTCDDKQGPARELLSWELAQKYFLDPTFGGAVIPGQRNVFDTTADFTGIAFLTEPRRFSPLISRLRAQEFGTDFHWLVDYDPVFRQINASTILAGRGFGSWYLSGGSTYMRLPAEVSTNALTLPAEVVNQYRIMARYGDISRRGFSGAASFAVDARLSYVQGTTVQTSYSWDCCGVTFLYSRFAPGAGLATENSYKFSFSLTNVGTFGSIRNQQRLY